MAAKKWTYANILNPAPRWDPAGKDTVQLWHGCTRDDADNIWKFGIDLTKCREDADFGQGFYLTEIERQARHWAWIRYYDQPLVRQAINPPVILGFVLNRADLAPLHSLSFVSGSFDSEGYWSLVQYCRQSPKRPHHFTHLYMPRHLQPNPAIPSGWYDLVHGPVSAFWHQRMATYDEDQVSFHTDHSIDLLDDFIRASRTTNDQTWIKSVP